MAQSEGSANVLVAPVLPYGNSHHHRPFPGVLSLSSDTFMAAVTDILEGLVLSGFRKVIVLNGHGGNTDSNAVVGLDFVNRLGHDVSIATASYWDIARPAIVESGIMAGDLIPGHAGQFEASLVMALRPDLIDEQALARCAGHVTDCPGSILGHGWGHRAGPWRLGCRRRLHGQPCGCDLRPGRDYLGDHRATRRRLLHCVLRPRRRFLGEPWEKASFSRPQPIVCRPAQKRFDTPRMGGAVRPTKWRILQCSGASG